MTRTILLADDSVTIQKVVELTFVDEGYRVIAVGNGADAAARLAEVAPDIAILDVHMPGVNGFELCRRVKDWRPEAPVLLLVGTFEPFDKGEYSASGADAFLKKPFDSQELLRQVEDLLRTSTPPAAVSADAAAPDAAAGDLGAGEPTWGNLDFEPGPEIEPEAAYAAIGSPAAGALEDTAAEPTVGPAVEPPAAPPKELSDQDVDRIARRVVEILSEKVVREVSWEVVPDLAEVIIKDRIRELEKEAE
ncbi:MAG TPA: response regulator [Thermoanaerobaculia bacterium]|nr:response regulator [Thermoanaerobaculia bacterium]